MKKKCSVRISMLSPCHNLTPVFFKYNGVQRGPNVWDHCWICLCLFYYKISFFFSNWDVMRRMINLTWLASVFLECSCVISLNQKTSLFSLPSVKASCPHRAKAFHPQLNLNTTASIMNEGDRHGERARNEEEV